MFQPPAICIYLLPAALVVWVAAGCKSDLTVQVKSGGTVTEDRQSTVTEDGTDDSDDSAISDTSDSAEEKNPETNTEAPEIPDVSNVDVLGVPLLLSNQKSFFLTITGDGVGSYRVAHSGTEHDCQSGQYTDWIQSAIPYHVNATEGINQICVQLKTNTGHLVPEYRKYLWTLDSTPPVAGLTNTPELMSVTDSFSFVITGDEVVEYAAVLTTAADCSAVTFDSWVSKTEAFAATTTRRQNRVCVSGKDLAGNIQTQPTEFAWTVDIGPVVTGSDPVSANEDAVTPVTQSNITVTAFDHTTTEVVITITTGPVRGRLLFDGVPVVSYPLVLTQADINLGKLSYEHQNRAESDSMKFTAADPSGGLVPETTLIIDVVPKCSGALLTATPFAYGSGSGVDPYLICTPAQWNAIGDVPAHQSATFVIFSDLDFAGEALTPAGSLANPFTGSVDGREYIVRNVTYAAAGNFAGLFSYVNGGVLRNMTLENFAISCPAGNGCGSLVGQLESGQVINVKSEGNVSGISEIGGLIGIAKGTVTGAAFVASGNITGTTDNIGGLIGIAQGVTISNATVTTSNGSKVTGASGIGGIAGSMESGSVAGRMVASIGVESSYWIVGGLIGYTDNSTITESYATGVVTHTLAGRCSMAGGLIGMQSSGTSVSRSFATGAVNAAGAVAGGFVGWIDFTATIDNSYATGNVSSKRTNTGSGVNGCTTTSSAAYAGGFAGVMAGGGTISNSYAKGNANGNDGNENGGFIGMAIQQTLVWNTVNNFSVGASSGSATNNGFMGRRANGVGESGSYWDSFLSGQSVMCGGTAGGGCSDTRGINTSLVGNEDYFFNKTNAPLSSWDFTTIWQDRADDYPLLRWQN